MHSKRSPNYIWKKSPKNFAVSAAKLIFTSSNKQTMNCEKILHVFLIVWVLYYIVRELILITKAHIKFRQWVKDYRAKKKADNNDDEQLTA